MNLNDRIASSLLAAKVGAIREGSRIANSRVETAVDRALATVEAAARRDTGQEWRTAGKAAREAGIELGQQVERELKDFADRRVQAVLQRARDAGADLKAPTRPLSVSFLNGTIKRHFERTSERAAARARAVVREGGEPTLAVAALRANARAVTMSGANAAHNSAVLAVARANKKLVAGVMALATLDDRTTALCERRHGGAWDLTTLRPLPVSSVSIEFPGRPPWHFNCRTTLTLVMAGEDDPEIQDEQADAWLDTADAADSVGDDAIQLYRRGVISRSQMFTLSDKEEESSGP